MKAPIVDLDQVVATAPLDVSLVPEQARRHTEHVVADTVAIAIAIAIAVAGARSPEVTALVAADLAEGLVSGTPPVVGHTATVLTSPTRHDAQWPEAAPARVGVVSDGGTRTATVTNPTGHYANPLGEHELRVKFDRLVDDSSRADLWWRSFTSLHELPDCSVLFTEAD
jgi:2-methylcitrate dehydratase PrpD